MSLLALPARAPSFPTLLVPPTERSLALERRSRARHSNCLAAQAQQEIGGGRAPVPEDFQRIENLAFEDFALRIGLSEDVVPAFMEKIFGLQKEHWKFDVFSEVIPVLKQLSKDHHLVVVTSSQSDSVVENLEHFDLRNLFSNVLGGELGLSKSERISRSCEEVGIPKEQTYMVGDAISDIRQGKIAGVTTIAVSWGYQDRELLLAEEPDFMVDEPSELLEIVLT